MLPHGFASAEEFQNFGATLYNGLAQAGYPEAEGILQGSAVTGVKFTTGVPFDVGRVSDFDVALVSPDLLQAADEAGIELRGDGTRTGPLGPDDVEALGLTELQQQLSEQAGRPVNFMIFGSREVALGKAPSIPIPRGN